MEGVHSGSTKTLTFKGPAALTGLCSLLDRGEQNASKLQHTVCNAFIKLFGNLKGSLGDVYRSCSALKG